MLDQWRLNFMGNPTFFDMPVIDRPIIKGQFNPKVMNYRDLLMYNTYPFVHPTK
ncbi:hypothetical protein [Spiroplasma endosymbiont of Polydrusus formosus]|uniref:hypothetical protein n=1 Tax=Spiroplasma endosymbiont of Polydrusus formosus TaxID=3139326 RepID=UPI0035B521DF